MRDEMDELDRLAIQAAEHWRPITEAAGFPDHPAADPAFMREVIETNLDAMVARSRSDLRVLPWPLRVYLRVRRLFS